MGGLDGTQASSTISLGLERALAAVPGASLIQSGAEPRQHLGAAMSGAPCAQPLAPGVDLLFGTLGVAAAVPAERVDDGVGRMGHGDVVVGSHAHHAA